MKELALGSPDAAVRREAAEAFSDQPADRAIPALESVIASSTDDGTLGEAVEALGDIGRRLEPRRRAYEHARVLDRIEQELEAAIFEDPDRSVRVEAMDALEQLPAPRAKRVLQKIIDRHPDGQMREEAKDLDQERNR